MMAPSTIDLQLRCDTCIYIAEQENEIARSMMVGILDLPSPPVHRSLQGINNRSPDTDRVQRQIKKRQIRKKEGQ